jgi:ComF family protein
MRWLGPQIGWRQTFRFVDVANLALSRLFEPPCAACGETLQRPLDGAACELCWSGIHRITPPVCDRCGDPLPSPYTSFPEPWCGLCAGAEHCVGRSRSIGAYEGRLRDVIHALKYDGRRSVGVRLAALMRVAGADVLNGADCVVPVPLHPGRERARGFNQSEDLARSLGLPVVRLLRRTRPTQPQVDLPASRRMQNVKDAFAITRCSRLTELKGLVLVLVDDVSTTGATLEACARVLKVAGAREVRALTAARVVSGPR